jgi:hypothetical protein
MMSFADFSKILVQSYGKPQNFFEKEILDKMKNYCTISMQAVKNKIMP